VFGARVSKDTISRITEKVIGEMTEWQNRPLDRVLPVVFIDAIHVKVRDGQVTNRPVYVAIGVSVNGERDILGLWAGDGGEGAKFWLSVLTEIKNRGVEDVCITVCDGLKGLPEAITTVWEFAVVQTCIVYLIRNTFRYAARQYWGEMSRDLRPVYTAPSEAAAKERFVEFSGKWGRQYRRSPGCGGTPGASSCRSWTMTLKSGGSSAAPTPSNPSTPGTGARSGPGAISSPSRLP
jgi:putative transposase